MELNTIVLAVAGFFASFYLKQLVSEIKEVSISVKELNIKMAHIVERTENHTKEISMLREKQEEVSLDVAKIKSKISVHEDNQ